jgi:transposase-like protein
LETRKIAAEYRLAHWAGVMRERNERGASVRVFCKDKGIHENTYYYWQRRLREAAYTGMAGTGLAPSGFAEVELVGEPASSLQAPAKESKISISVSDIQITAGSGYPAEKLAAVLRGLVGVC